MNSYLPLKWYLTRRSQKKGPWRIYCGGVVDVYGLVMRTDMSPGFHFKKERKNTKWRSKYQREKERNEEIIVSKAGSP